MPCLSSICRCETTKYFDNNLRECVDKTLEGTSCQADVTCRSDQGLSCQQSSCECDSSTQFWSATQVKCINYLSYGESNCTDNKQCSTNLICNLNVSANNCNCPKSSSNGMCDCPRVFNNETYWNGSHCVPALKYGDKCPNGKDFTCEQFREGNLKCYNSVCLCGGSDSGLGSNGKCKRCKDDIGEAEYLYSDTCFTFSADSESFPYAQAACAAIPNGKLVILKNETKLSFVMSKKDNDDAYWVDASEVSASWSWSDSTRTPLATNQFCASNFGTYQCLRIREDFNCFETADCSSDSNFICEYPV